MVRGPCNNEFKSINMNKDVLVRQVDVNQNTANLAIGVYLSLIVDRLSEG